ARAEAALRRIESLRSKPASLGLRTSFFATKQDFYLFAIDLLLELHRRDPSAGHAARALAVSEQARSRSLLDLLAASGADVRQGAGPRPLSLAEIRRQVLDPGTLLLEISLGDERSVLWAVTRDSFASFELPPRAVLTEAALRAHSLLAAGDQALGRAATAQAL